MNDEKNGPGTADQIGQAAGGITGVLAGTIFGAAGGPLGVLLGGIAGAIGGWWTGRAIVEAAGDIGEADERYYREHFETTAADRADFEKARDAYFLGDIAAANPDYAGRGFEDAEKELERGWARSARGAGDWRVVRDFARAGFARGRDRRRTTRITNDRRSAVPDDAQP